MGSFRAFCIGTYEHPTHIGGRPVPPWAATTGFLAVGPCGWAGDLPLGLAPSWRDMFQAPCPNCGGTIKPVPPWELAALAGGGGG
jgi:hypothetical protein